MSGRRAFTLVEMMMASGIFVLVAGGVMGSFVSVRNLATAAFAEAESSIRMRELREKLLFHVAPPHDGKVWSGILSGARNDGGSVVEGGGKVLMNLAWGYDTQNSEAVAQDIELVCAQKVSSNGDALRYFVNDGDRYDDQWATKWLAPGGMSWLPQSGHLDDDRLADGNVFYVNLESSVVIDRAQQPLKRCERVVVPVFGKAQRTVAKQRKVFDD